nr:hypothetical protein [Streptomyces sp. t39]
MGAGVVGAEVHPGKAIGGGLPKLVLVGALLACGEQLGGVLGRQGLGNGPDPGIVGRTVGRFEAEAGAGGDDQPALCRATSGGKVGGRAACEAWWKR